MLAAVWNGGSEYIVVVGHVVFMNPTDCVLYDKFVINTYSNSCSNV